MIPAWPAGDLINGPAFLVVSGKVLSGARMYAHVGGIYIQLCKSNLSLKAANTEWLEQVGIVSMILISKCLSKHVMTMHGQDIRSV